MKVGVYFGEIELTVGGGFTFQDDIFHSLLELSNESGHTFTIFTPRPERLRETVTSSNIQLVAYNRGPVEKISYRLRKWIPPLRETMKYPSRLDRSARALGIEFIWFAGSIYFPVDIPYLCTVLDLQHRLQPWFPEISIAGRWYFREAYFSDMLQRASAIIAGTQAGKEEIVRFYQVPPERVKLLAHPTPQFALNVHENGNQSTRVDKYKIPPNYLFYPAQFWSHKNHAGLLKAIYILRKKHGLKLPVVFVGSDKGNLVYIKQLVKRLKLDDQVYFLGFVPQEDLIDLYRNALALTYLTFFGPENLPPLEAFALGCPVIASAVSGAEEQLGEAAILVEPTDYTKVALAIKSLYESPKQRQNLIERGKIRAAQWTGRDFVRGVFSIFDEFEPIRFSWSM